ncbi:hypothetical protein [Streptomyces sp. NPDC058373]|uniref:hypothetical protein n=1 Tax=Streptomyces sp. NPDC058373 TaxID=3346465 RepID=UPI003661BACC
MDASPPRPRRAPDAGPEHLSAAETDRVLEALAEAGEALLAQSQERRRYADALDGRREALIGLTSDLALGALYDPATIRLDVDQRLAHRAAREHEAATGEYVAWWADVAVTAWRAADAGERPRRVRLVGAAPECLLGDEELASLPAVDEEARHLVEFSAWLGTADPTGRGPDGVPPARRPPAPRPTGSHQRSPCSIARTPRRTDAGVVPAAGAPERWARGSARGPGVAGLRSGLLGGRGLRRAGMSAMVIGPRTRKPAATWPPDRHPALPLSLA